MANIISQICGIIVFITIFASMQTKKITMVLFWHMLCNAFGAISYMLLGGLSGSGVFFVATIQSLILFILRVKKKEVPKWFNVIVFAAYIICSLATFKTAKDIVPTIAAVLCALALMQKRSSNYRIIILFNGIAWLVYDIIMGAYTLLASRIFTVASALLGIIRLDILKKEEK